MSSSTTTRSVTTVQSSRPAASRSNAAPRPIATQTPGLNINYRSPQDAFNDAINYSEDDDDYEQTMQEKHGKMERLMTNMLKGVNDSKYIYPAIAIIVITILVVLILFQKVAVSIKVIASLLLIVFIAFTVFLNKH